MYAVQNNNNNNKYKEYILETPNQNDIHIVGPIASILESLMDYIQNNYKKQKLDTLSVHHVSCADNLEFIFHSIGIDSVMFEFP